MPTTTNSKILTFRLSEDLAEELDLIVRVDGVPVSEIIRQAIAAHVAIRRADSQFRRRFRERIEADQQILARLADGETP